MQRSHVATKRVPGNREVLGGFRVGRDRRLELSAASERLTQVVLIEPVLGLKFHDPPPMQRRGGPPPRGVAGAGLAEMPGELLLARRAKTLRPVAAQLLPGIVRGGVMEQQTVATQLAGRQRARQPLEARQPLRLLAQVPKPN